MAYSNFKPTIWSKQVQLDLDKLMVFKEVCNSDFQGDVGRGKTVKIIGLTKPTVKTYTPGTAIAAAETPTDSAMTLAVDQYKYVNFMVDDVDEAQAAVTPMKSLMKGATSELAEAADSYIASLVVNAKSSNIITKTTAITTEAAAKKAVDEAFVALWNEGVKTGRDTYIVVAPWFYSLFKGALTEVLTNNVDMVEKGIFGMYNGCMVKLSNNIYNDGTYDCMSIMTKNAITFAQGIEEVNAYRPQDSFSDAVKILHTYGAKVVRPEQLVCLKVKQ